MITDQAYKLQEEKEEKIDWQEKVKREFPYDWPECLAAIQTAEEIIGTEEQRWIINWEKVYQACQVPRTPYQLWSTDIFFRFIIEKK